MHYSWAQKSTYTNFKWHGFSRSQICVISKTIIFEQTTVLQNICLCVLYRAFKTAVGTHGLVLGKGLSCVIVGKKVRHLDRCVIWPRHVPPYPLDTLCLPFIKRIDAISLRIHTFDTMYFISQARTLSEKIRPGFNDSGVDSVQFSEVTSCSWVAYFRQVWWNWVIQSYIIIFINLEWAYMWTFIV